MWSRWRILQFVLMFAVGTALGIGVGVGWSGLTRSAIDRETDTVRQKLQTIASARTSESRLEALEKLRAWLNTSTGSQWNLRRQQGTIDAFFLPRDHHLNEDLVVHRDAVAGEIEAHDRWPVWVGFEIQRCAQLKSAFSQSWLAKATQSLRLAVVETEEPEQMPRLEVTFLIWSQEEAEALNQLARGSSYVLDGSNRDPSESGIDVVERRVDVASVINNY